MQINTTTTTTFFTTLVTIFNTTSQVNIPLSFTAKMFKTVLFVCLNLFSLAVLGLPATGLTVNANGVITAGFDSPGAMLTTHTSSDCSGESQGSYYLLSGQPIWNNPASGTMSISVGSNKDNTEINYFSGSQASGTKLGSSTGNNVCAQFGGEIKSAELVL